MKQEPTLEQRIVEVYDEVLSFMKFKLYISDEDVEDLVHDTILKMLEKSKTFDSSKGKFKTYFITCIFNKLIDNGRGNKSKPLRNIIDLQSNKKFNNFGENEYLIDLVGYQNTHIDIDVLKLNEVLMGVSIFLLYPTLLYAQGFSYKEISKILETSDKNVKSRIRRGREQIAIRARILFGENIVTKMKRYG